MSKAKNVSVSIIEHDGQIHVWNATFNIKGFIPRKDGKIDEAARMKIQRRIAQVLEQMEFPED